MAEYEDAVDDRSCDPQTRFLEELFELLGRWSEKPADDRITVAQLIGCLEIVKVQYLHRHAEEDW